LYQFQSATGLAKSEAKLRAIPNEFYGEEQAEILTKELAKSVLP